MKKIVTLLVIAFIALSADTTAQSSGGGFWGGPSNGNTFYGNKDKNKNNNGNGNGNSSGGAVIGVQSQVDASVSYLNTPINIVSALTVGLGKMPTTMNGTVSPTFFLLENQIASFENFQFEVRGAVDATVDIAWSVTGSNNNVVIQSAKAEVTYHGEDGDRHKNTKGQGHSSRGNGNGYGHYTEGFMVTDYNDGIQGDNNSFGNSFDNISFGSGDKKKDKGHGDDGTENGTGHSQRGGTNGNGFGYGHYRENEEANFINVNIDFTVKAINEPPDDGFPNGSGDPTNTTTTFMIKVEISNYDMLGSFCF